MIRRRLEQRSSREDVSEQILVPMAERKEWLGMIHEGIAGHLGSFKTQAHVRRHLYWYQWRRDVDLFIKQCPRCSQYYRGRHQPKQGLLMPMRTGRPVERWSVDLAGQFPKSARGFVYILTAVCTFSKFIVLVPLRDKTALTVATALWNHVFLRFGIGELLSDNGLDFRNDLLNELCRMMGIARCFTSPYEPRTNAVCERNHATVNSMMAKCVDAHHRDWDQYLNQIAFCYNASVHDTTLFTPFFLMHGMEPRWDVDVRLGQDVRPRYAVNDYAAHLIGSLEEAYQLAREHLGKGAVRMKDWYDKKVHIQDFVPGEKVYILNLRLYQGRCPKWLNRYSDEGTIVRKLNSVTYVVRCEKWRSKTRIIHVDKIKRIHVFPEPSAVRCA